MEHEELTEKIIGVFYRVYNCLGYGFLEKVYENALKVEFEKSGLSFENQKSSHDSVKKVGCPCRDSNPGHRRSPMKSR